MSIPSRAGTLASGTRTSAAYGRIATCRRTTTRRRATARRRTSAYRGTSATAATATDLTPLPHASQRQSRRSRDSRTCDDRAHVHLDPVDHIHLAGHSSVSSHFFFLGGVFASNLYPGPATGMRLSPLILLCSFLESLENSLSAAFLSFDFPMIHLSHCVWCCQYLHFCLRAVSARRTIRSSASACTAHQLIRPPNCMIRLSTHSTVPTTRILFVLVRSCCCSS